MLPSWVLALIASMDSSGNLEFQAELTSWCKKAVVDEMHAILLVGVPAEVDVAHIEDVAQTVKA